MPVSITTVPAANADSTLGQLWKYNETGGDWWAPNLSKELRSEVQKRCRFRQFTDMKDDSQGGAKHSGETFHWNIYSELETAISTAPVDEEDDLPLSRMRVQQGSVTVNEYGMAVPYTGIFDDLSEHPVREIIRQKLKIHCARTLDLLAYKQFEATQLKVVPQGGTSATAVQLTDNGTPAAANDAPLTWAHCKQIARYMRERDIPTYDNGDYYALARPFTYSVVEDDLENIHQYTDPGFKLIRDGEKGRGNGIRFVEQTNIDSQYSVLGAPWATGKSDQAFFFGDDQVSECVVIPEEIRGAIAQSHGRKKSIAWYYVGAFAKTRQAAFDERCVEWGSTG